MLGTIFYYYPNIKEELKNTPKFEEFNHFFDLWGEHVFLIDRTETFPMPFKVKVLNPIPKFRPFHESYDEVCEKHTKKLIQFLKEKNKHLYIAYSGGIDSTLLVVLFLKYSDSGFKNNITLLITDESIKENPRFYKEHIFGKLKVEHVSNIDSFFNENSYFLSGELNDQILGMGSVMKNLDFKEYIGEYSRDVILKYLAGRNEDEKLNNYYMSMFEQLKDKCPVEIKTNFDFFWWLNFTWKWQFGSLRYLLYFSKENQDKILCGGIENYFSAFFNTEDFQLWSLNNMDKKIKDTPESFKYVSKEIIYEYTKDKDFFDYKLKVGSVTKIQKFPGSYNLVDEEFKGHFKLNL
jgi:hypothetical protein